jgi:hypothetical protein
MRDVPRDEDIVELGSPGPGRRLFGGRFPRSGGWGPPQRWRPARGATAFAVTALALGLVVGYTAGDWHGRRGTALPEPPAAASSSAAAASAAAASAAAAAASASAAASFPFAYSSALVQEPGACSVQSGRHLALGVQVTNLSPVPVTLRSAEAVLPLGGLTETGSWHWTPCGALPQTLVGQAVEILQPGASAWLTMTFSVNANVGCPAPLPVQFTIGYLAAGHSLTASLPGFPDLGQVPYTGCPPVSAAAVSLHFRTAGSSERACPRAGPFGSALTRRRPPERGGFGGRSRGLCLPLCRQGRRRQAEGGSYPRHWCRCP